MNIEAKVRERALTPLSGHLNLVQRKKEKEIELKHKEICEQVVDFADKNPSIPMYVILSVGIAAGAFKTSIFDKKYKKFDKEKVNVVRDMAYAYNEHMGLTGKPTDVTWRLANRYYTKKSHNIADFKTDLAKSNKMDGSRGHYDELCKNLGI